MQLADLSGIRPLFLNKQAHKSHVLQHRKKGFASRANPFNLQIISYIYFSDTSISVQVFNRSLRRCKGILIINYIDRVWETFGKHLFHVLHILLPCANRLFSIPFYSSFNFFYFVG